MDVQRKNIFSQHYENIYTILEAKVCEQTLMLAHGQLEARIQYNDPHLIYSSTVNLRHKQLFLRIFAKISCILTWSCMYLSIQAPNEARVNVSLGLEMKTAVEHWLFHVFLCLNDVKSLECFNWQDLETLLRTVSGRTPITLFAPTVIFCLMEVKII